MNTIIYCVYEVKLETLINYRYTMMRLTSTAPKPSPALGEVGREFFDAEDLAPTIATQSIYSAIVGPCNRLEYTNVLVVVEQGYFC